MTENTNHITAQPEARPYLAGVMAGAAVALPLDVLETTIPCTEMVVSFLKNSPLMGLAVHQGRTVAVLSPSLFVKPDDNERTKAKVARIIVLRSGFGLFFDDLHFVSPAGLPADYTALDPAQFTGNSQTPHGSLPDQVFTFFMEGQRLAIRLGQLHHLKLAQASDITFSTELDALCHHDAPGIPVFQTTNKGALSGQWGHILYVNLADGTNCGFIVNDGEMADPGAPLECNIFECGPFVTSMAPFAGIAVPRHGQQLLLLDPDGYFAHCYQSTSPAVEGGVPLTDSNESASAGSGDFAA